MFRRFCKETLWEKLYETHSGAFHYPWGAPQNTFNAHFGGWNWHSLSIECFIKKLGVGFTSSLLWSHHLMSKINHTADLLQWPNLTLLLNFQPLENSFGELHKSSGTFPSPLLSIIESVGVDAGISAILPNHPCSTYVSPYHYGHIICTVWSHSHT